MSFIAFHILIGKIYFCVVNLGVLKNLCTGYRGSDLTGIKCFKLEVPLILISSVMDQNHAYFDTKWLWINKNWRGLMIYGLFGWVFWVLYKSRMRYNFLKCNIMTTNDYSYLCVLKMFNIRDIIRFNPRMKYF